MALCEAETAPVRTGVTPRDRSAVGARRDCADIMGVLIDRISRAGVLDQIDAFIQAGGAHQIVTINVDFLNIVHHEPAFLRVLNEAAISVPDGMPLLWVSRIVGRPLPQRITGSDLLCDCAALAARKGYRIFLLGAAPGVADAAARLLAARYPGLTVAGTYAPPPSAEFDAAENARMVALVRAARPDMLFVALGTPKQEKWIHQHLATLDVPVCIGVGGVFNFITGRIQRAPTSFQNAGLEWLFRLLKEPRRLWRRYLVDDSRAFGRAMAYALRKRRAARRAALAPGAAAHIPASPDYPDWHLPAIDPAGAAAPPTTVD